LVILLRRPHKITKKDNSQPSQPGPAAASRNSTAGYGLWTLRRLTAAARGSTVTLLFVYRFWQCWCMKQRES